MRVPVNTGYDGLSSLTRYLIKRLLWVFPVLLGSTLIIFFILHLAPGDPVRLMIGSRATPEDYARAYQQLGLDQPLPIQYLTFMGNIFQGDLGYSIIKRETVSSLILSRLSNTLELTLSALFLSYLFALPLGILAAVKQNTLWDYMGMGISLLGISMPGFWLGFLLIFLFSVRLNLFPVSGYGGIRYLVLPAFTLSMESAAITARMMRSSMLEVIRQDYIQTARAKGLAKRVVIYKHALKNALIPVITLLGLRLGWLIGGSVIIETVFSRPGLGRLLISSIYNRDYPVVQGIMIILVFTVIIGNIIADILYASVDPRIRYH